VAKNFTLLLVARLIAHHASQCQTEIGDRDLCLIPDRQVAVRGEGETSRIHLRAATVDHTDMPGFLDRDSNRHRELERCQRRLSDAF
jgi:hypothetical protein